MRDQYNREIRYARISITNRCNYRCTYCYLDNVRKEEMTLNEYEKLFEALKSIGIRKVRITGGEPTVRKDVIDIVKLASSNFKEVNMTTNGHFVKELASRLKKAGLSGLNISLDTLNERLFERITGVDGLKNVLEGIEEALIVGLKVKLNTVLTVDTKNEIFELINFAERLGVPIRFIELMPFGNFTEDLRIKEEEIFKLLETRYGKLHPTKLKPGEGPAKYYKIGKTYVGFISAFSRDICSTCNKIRISFDGKLIPCLGKNIKYDIRNLLHNKEKLEEKIRKAIFFKPKHHNFEELKTKGLNEMGG
ncbi:GTP 3',8-cyclase MoaA [Thermosipho ferrireducens]|uniref:GTP 3',8-cyclase MoaA n=1 Tax=Thermosipho ferrireducens TaxID=2571116 RepID=A0ABX7S703_9BACT|nr:GTP 3',8-cyclase MoaA [Thermosipho ferrireducens]QTA38362.1 GTP 3',8-cyclase MoaA [Thermosipho ferrireducens]